MWAVCDTASAGKDLFLHSPSFVTSGKQSAHPVATQLTAGNQEAGLCAGDESTLKQLPEHLIWGL